MSPDPVRAAPRAPERIGRYLVFPAFARGGMASVHLGRLGGASGFTRIVAVKRLHPIFAASQEHYRMLLDEARITARIEHPNVVPILDVLHEEGELCLVMQYVAGVSLAELLDGARRSGQRMPPAIAVAIVVDLLRGLHAAHEAKGEDGAPLGVVHRDVSPHNVLVGADGLARVLDFGIAKALRKEGLTLSGEVKGKLSYMSPEQLRGAGVTRQSDVFACGICSWEALTGERLHPGDEAAAAVLRVLTDVPQPPSARVAGISAALDAICVRALALEPRARFATAEEMAVALLEACPPASREDVARFVEYVAIDELERRAELVRAAEGYRASVAPPSLPGGAVAAAASQAKPTRRRLALVLVASALLVGAAALAARAPFARARTVATAAAARSSAPSSPDTTASAPLPEIAPTAPVAASAASAPVAPSATAGRVPGARPTVTKRPVVAPRCDPNYSIDETGRKHYKPECFSP